MCSRPDQAREAPGRACCSGLLPGAPRPDLLRQLPHPASPAPSCAMSPSFWLGGLYPSVPCLPPESPAPQCAIQGTRRGPGARVRWSLLSCRPSLSFPVSEGSSLVCPEASHFPEAEQDTGLSASALQMQPLWGSPAACWQGECCAAHTPGGGGSRCAETEWRSPGLLGPGLTLQRGVPCSQPGQAALT